METVFRLLCRPDGGCEAFNFLASLINGNGIGLVVQLQHYRIPFNFLASLINGNSNASLRWR